MKKLQTEVCGITLNTPLLLGSGQITETPAFFLRSTLHGCSGMITRSLKKVVPTERKKTPAPRYAILDDHASMLNCEMSNGQPWTRWRDKWVKEVQQAGFPIIISLSGRDISGCSQLVKEFDQIGVTAFEINVSCSHSGALHGNLNIDFEHLRKLVSTARKITKNAIWVKLSYSPWICEMAKIAEQNGADGIVTTNTVGPGLLIDTQTSKPRLGVRGGAGGLSGPAIFPIALWCVYTVSQNVKIPVIGVGGISNADNVIQMLMAGASAVQLYTKPALEGPEIFLPIVRDLKLFLEQHPEYVDIKSLVGLAHRWRKDNSFSAPCPTIDADCCVGCGECQRGCLFNAIALNPKAAIGPNCISCNACVGICPTTAIKATY